MLILANKYIENFINWSFGLKHLSNIIYYIYVFIITLIMYTSLLDLNK